MKCMEALRRINIPWGRPASYYITKLKLGRPARDPGPAPGNPSPAPPWWTDYEEYYKGVRGAAQSGGMGVGGQLLSPTGPKAAARKRARGGEGGKGIWREQKLCPSLFSGGRNSVPPRMLFSDMAFSHCAQQF